MANQGMPQTTLPLLCTNIKNIDQNLTCYATLV